MRDHVLHTCDDDHCEVCEGGLAWCTVCGVAEGTLPTACPGVQMTPAQSDAAMSGDLDYVAGAWVDTSGPEETKPVVGLVLGGFFRAVQEAPDTQTLVSVWVECRADLQKNLGARLRVEAWAALCRRAEQLGQKHPKVRMKRAVLEEVERRAEAFRRTERWPDE